MGPGKSRLQSPVWLHRYVRSSIRKVRQEDLKCKASLGYKTGPSQNTNQTKQMKRLWVWHSGYWRPR